MATRGVQEGLELGRHHAEARGESEDEGVEGGQHVDGDDGNVSGLGGRVHLAQDLGGQGLRHLVKVALDSLDGVDALLDLAGERLDMTVG